LGRQCNVRPRDGKMSSRSRLRTGHGFHHSSSPPPDIPERSVKFLSISIGIISAVVKDVSKKSFISRNRAMAPPLPLRGDAEAVAKIPCPTFR
jgi:hypothetical protein